MRPKLFIILLFLFGYCHIGEAQILKKLKKKVNEISQKAVGEIEKIEKVPCLISDKDCIEKAEQEGKEVVLTGNDNQTTSSGIPSNTSSNHAGVFNEKNIYSSSTNHSSYKTANKDFKISENGMHIAHVDFEGSRKVIKINGKAEPLADDVFFDFFEFSPSGKRYAYLAQFESECHVVIDGKKGQKVQCPARGTGYYRFRGKPMFYFTEDDSKLAYVHPKSNNLGINYNGNNLPGSISLSTTAQNKDPILVRGNKIFFTLYEDDLTTLFINGGRQASHNDLTYLEVSNDGKHYAYTARDFNAEQELKIVIDGKEFPKSNPNYTLFNMDRNSGMVSYINNKVLMVNGKPISKEMDRNTSAKVIFSKNGRSHALIYENRNIRQSRIQFNGKEMPPFEDIKEISFTNDGNSLVYIAGNGGKYFVIENEKEIGPFDSAQDLIFSEEGNSYAFKGRKDRGEIFNWYVNGKKISPAKGTIVFSKDGSRYAFVSSGDGNYNSPDAWVIDGKKFTGRLSAFRPDGDADRAYQNFIFNPVNNKLAYIIRENYDKGLWRSVVLYDDKVLTGVDRGTTFLKPVFSDNGENIAILMGQPQSSKPYSWKVYLNLKPGPIVGQPTSPSRNQHFDYSNFLDNKNFRTIGLEGETLEVYTVSY